MSTPRISKLILQQNKQGSKNWKSEFLSLFWLLSSENWSAMAAKLKKRALAEYQSQVIDLDEEEKKLKANKKLKLLLPPRRTDSTSSSSKLFNLNLLMILNSVFLQLPPRQLGDSQLARREMWKTCYITQFCLHPQSWMGRCLCTKSKNSSKSWT